jgi:branched-subunit amino acid transport protein AzlD
MDSMTEFTLRAAIFMAVFLLLAYYLFKHIEKIRKAHGMPKETGNYMLVLKHFFMPKDEKK